MSKQSLLSILLIAGVFHTGYGFGAAPQNAPSKKQDSPCPSIARKFPNFELKDISAEALAHLRKYSLPIGDRAAFCRYLEHIQHDHEVKVEEGLLDMMGDYFLATQKIETGYYFSYKIGFPEREIPQVVLDRASSESEQADLFSRPSIPIRTGRGKRYSKDRLKLCQLRPEKKVPSNSFDCCWRSPGSSIPRFKNTWNPKATTTTVTFS